MNENPTRCLWAADVKPFYQAYHDQEWGVPVHDDRLLFEMLILEGAQAGLSWETILKRRDGYRKAFHNFDPAKVARMTDAKLEALLANADIIRNRLKVFGARKNAIAFRAIQKEFGSFDAYVWNFVGGKPQVNRSESRCLSQLRDTLLPKLISGELRIKDAEQFIERVEAARE